MRRMIYHGHVYPMYLLPDEMQAYKAKWWSIRQAANAWGVHRTTAARIIRMMPTAYQAQYVLTWNKRRGLRARLCVPVGVKRLKWPWHGGNPRFNNRDFQREMAARRWAKPGAAGAARAKTMAQHEKARQYRASAHPSVVL